MFGHKKAENRIELYQAELLKTHYSEVENMYKKIRGWRHDYANHIQVMKVHAQNGDLSAIKNYLDLLENDLKTVDTIVKTGNSMVDAIMNSKLSLAKASNIKVIIDANIPIKLNLSDIDLCVIIGNLFDNAIEASLALSEENRLIRIYMDIKNTQVYISFTNFTKDNKRKKSGNIFKSTKGEKHGFGLLRIDNTVNKLNGYINRNSENGAFTTEILLPCI